MPIPNEVLVSLDESDLIAYCERQEQKITALTVNNEFLSKELDRLRLRVVLTQRNHALR